jgi:hypothetical protein
MTPMRRTLALLRDRGYLCAIVEKRNHIGITQDLFGFGDVLALRKGEVLLVQTTSGANAAARVAKIVDSALYPRVVESGIVVHVHGWRKLKAGWACREVEL